jgi:penicillin-binding protein 2
MLNAPLNALRDMPSQAGSAWSAANPATRVAALFAGIALVTCGVAARLAWVQLALSDDYVAVFDQTFESFEPIESRRGRILASGGEVLAQDVDTWAVAIHYRWLEDPPRPEWVRQQAMARLDRASRRDAKRVDAEASAVLAQRDALWRQLAALAGTVPGGLLKRRQAIQRRVAAIRLRVESRRAQQAADFEAAQRADDSLTWWQRAYGAVASALTTPPVREEAEPVVLREELDYHRLLEDISLEAAIEIEGHPERYPGTRIASSGTRVYPCGSVAVHLIGHRAMLDEEALRERSDPLSGHDPLDYRSGDSIGRMRLEQYYERHLRGLRGRKRIVRDRRGEIVSEEVVREPRLGRDLILSLNLPMQRTAERLLDQALERDRVDEKTGRTVPRPKGGAIVALDVRTGAVLAAASAPRFEPPGSPRYDFREFRRQLADPRKPLFHRAIAMALPPGSTFKVVSAVAGLESGSLDPAFEFHCQGYLDHPDRYRCLTFKNSGVGHAGVDLADALARSCNVYFFTAARKMGPGPLADWAARFGFGQLTGIDLPGEKPGRVPMAGADSPGSGAPGPRSLAGGETLQFAIGQGRLAATPIQVARLMSAIANGGRLVTPRLADSAGPQAQTADALATESMDSADPIAIEGLSKRTLEWVRLGLVRVVADRQGTGFRSVRLEEVAIAGKTGTAEPGGGRPDHAWFAGYVPAERPRVAFVVVLEHAGSGSQSAGPIAREFVKALAEQGLTGEPAVAAPSAN